MALDFVKGLFVKKTQYDTILSVKVDELIEELKTKKDEKGWANIKIKTARDGSKMYGVWDDWKPNNNGGSSQKKGGYSKSSQQKGGYSSNVDDGSDLPF